MKLANRRIQEFTALAIALAIANSHAAFAMGSKRQSDPEKDRGKQEQEQKDKAEAELQAKREFMTEFNIEIANFAWGRIKDDVSRCRNVQAISGDSVENIKAQIDGRFDWSTKCTQARLDKADGDIPQEYKTLLRQKLNDPDHKIDPMLEHKYQTYLATEPAILYKELYKNELDVLNSNKGRIGKTNKFPLYPVWGVPKANEDNFIIPKEHAGWVAPKNVAAPCDVIPNYHGSFPIEFFNPVVFCEAGCFEPSQQLATQSGYQSAGSIHIGASLVHLTKDSSLDKILFGTHSVASVIRSDGSEGEEMVEAKTLSGKTLRVTTSHPVLGADGVMRPAAQLKQGDMLLAVDDYGLASPDPITEIFGYTSHERVVNFRINSDDLKENVIIAEGLLVGTALYQNELRDQMNRGMMRVLIPESVITN